MQGTIIRAVGGFYYVESGGTVYECRARGIFRKDGITPLVGDDVEMSLVAKPFMQPSASSPEMGVGAVDKILPRINFFERPPVANIGLLILVASVKKPAPSFLMLDRFALAAEKKNAELLICVNKTDLADEGELEAFKEHYKNAYSVIFISAKDGLGIDALKEAVKGKKAALAGPSGVGKSTITNLLLGDVISRTGEISEKLRRGKNTTRHTELFKGDGFYLFDTPGFTSFENFGLEPAEISALFPEFEKYLGKCRFDNCRHISEPECAVREAVKSGAVSKGRYESYKEIYKTAEAAKKY